eukprot:TRINITY_DN9497_c0_g2_i3.p1 TRINITY_DN9497_c0_g2~~TRINITY_DN9497_c0_g2_i3.p1  ORF type:complete len:631 (+),score=118.62 TRINITY_DN9497_c0_g2_i3:248-2140(+)
MDPAKLALCVLPEIICDASTMIKEHGRVFGPDPQAAVPQRDRRKSWQLGISFAENADPVELSECVKASNNLVRSRRKSWQLKPGDVMPPTDVVPPPLTASKCDLHQALPGRRAARINLEKCAEEDEELSPRQQRKKTEAALLAEYNAVEDAATEDRIRFTRVFGCTLEEASARSVEATTDGSTASKSKRLCHWKETMVLVPSPVAECCRWLREHGLQTEGLFRIPGGRRRVTYWKHRFNLDPSTRIPEEESVNTVTSLLVRWLMELKDEQGGRAFLHIRRDPETHTNLYNLQAHHRRATATSPSLELDANGAEQDPAGVLRRRLGNLDALQVETLKEITGLLAEACQPENGANKMDPAKLALCVLPEIICDASTMIKEHGRVFGPDPQAAVPQRDRRKSWQLGISFAENADPVELSECVKASNNLVRSRRKSWQLKPGDVMPPTDVVPPPLTASKCDLHQALPEGELTAAPAARKRNRRQSWQLGAHDPQPSQSVKVTSDGVGARQQELVATPPASRQRNRRQSWQLGTHDQWIPIQPPPTADTILPAKKKSDHVLPVPVVQCFDFETAKGWVNNPAIGPVLTPAGESPTRARNRRKSWQGVQANPEPTEAQAKTGLRASGRRSPPGGRY